MSSAGVRDIVRFLVEHQMVDCIVTTGGGVEEDLMKCLAPTYLGEFNLQGSKLRKQGVNRIGNLLVPNNNYCTLENFIGPILDEMLEEQQTKVEIVGNICCLILIKTFSLENIVDTIQSRNTIW